MSEEIERYRYMQAREWLEHVRHLGIEADRIQGLVEAERASLDGVRGIDYTIEHVSGTRDLPDVANLVDSLFAHIQEYMASLAAYTDERHRAARALDALADPNERQALTRHYLMGETWREVAENMGYSKQRILAIRKQGVVHAYDVMPLDWRDPLPSAV